MSCKEKEKDGERDDIWEEEEEEHEDGDDDEEQVHASKVSCSSDFGHRYYDTTIAWHAMKCAFRHVPIQPGRLWG